MATEYLCRRLTQRNRLKEWLYMKRDMDLVRKILLAFEESEKSGSISYLEIDGYPKETINHHREIMCDAGLLEAIYHPRPAIQPEIIAYRITWFGHDFLDACRDENRWKQAKEVGVKIGGFTLDVLKQVLTQIMLSQVKQVMG